MGKKKDIILQSCNGELLSTISMMSSKGKLTIQDDYKVEFSEQLLEKCKTSSAYSAFKDITETQLRLPLVERPDKELLRIHRERFFPQ